MFSELFTCLISLILYPNYIVSEQVEQLVQVEDCGVGVVNSKQLC
jgi:hypothetical protein